MYLLYGIGYRKQIYNFREPSLSIPLINAVHIKYIQNSQDPSYLYCDMMAQSRNSWHRKGISW
jgi:hypothetical protein